MVTSHINYSANVILITVRNKSEINLLILQEIKELSHVGNELVKFRTVKRLDFLRTIHLTFEFLRLPRRRRGLRPLQGIRRVGQLNRFNRPA